MTKDHLIGAFWGAWASLFCYCLWWHFANYDASVWLIFLFIMGVIITGFLIIFE